MIEVGHFGNALVMKPQTGWSTLLSLRREHSERRHRTISNGTKTPNKVLQRTRSTVHC